MRFLDQFQQSYTDQLLVGPHNVIKQSFISQKNSLAGVRVSLSNANLGGSRIYQISLSDSSGIIRSQDISESNIGWKITFRYDFTSISDSKGKMYTISIHPLYKDESDSLLIGVNQERAQIAKISGITGEEKSLLESNFEKKYINVLYNKTDIYKNGTAFLNDTPLSGDIVFESYYSASVIGGIQNIFGNVSYKFRSDLIFSFFYFTLLFCICILILLRFAARKGEKAD